MRIRRKCRLIMWKSAHLPGNLCLSSWIMYIIIIIYDYFRECNRISQRIICVCVQKIPLDKILWLLDMHVVSVAVGMTTFLWPEPGVFVDQTTEQRKPAFLCASPASCTNPIHPNLLNSAAVCLKNVLHHSVTQHGKSTKCSCVQCHSWQTYEICVQPHPPTLTLAPSLAWRSVWSRSVYQR